MYWMLLLTPWILTSVVFAPGTAPAEWDLLCAVLALVGFVKAYQVRKAKRAEREADKNNR